MVQLEIDHMFLNLQILRDSFVAIPAELNTKKKTEDEFNPL